MENNTSRELILAHLDSHIRSWREHFNYPNARLRLRAIDACDALQQFRLQVFGSLLPQDDGNFGVFKEHGKSDLVKVQTHDEARAIYANET